MSLFELGHGLASDLDIRSPLMTRRTFLALAGRSGLALALYPASNHAGKDQREEVPPLIGIPGGSNLLATHEMQDIMRAGLGSYVVAGLALHRFERLFRTYDFSNLQNLGDEGRVLLRRYRTAGGQGIWRSLPEAQALYRKVPAPIRALGPQGLEEFHAGMDWSHIVPRSEGGADMADNGIWWDRKNNRDLGQRRMSRLDILDAKAVLLMKGVRAALVLAGKPLLTTAMASVVIVGVLSVLELGLWYYQGDISRKEFVFGVIRATAAAGAGTFIVTGLIMGLALAFPVLLPLLQVATVPLAVIGFVFLTNEVIELGDEWWAALDEQGHLPQFLADLQATEEFLGELSVWRRGRSQLIDPGMRSRLSDWMSRVAPDLNLDPPVPEFDYAAYFPDPNLEWMDLEFGGVGSEPIPGTIVDLGQRAKNVLPDWRQVVPQWEFDLGTGRFMPNLDLVKRLPALNLNVGDFLADIDLPALDNLSVPLPDFRKGTLSAQDALVSASAYLSSRRTLSLENASG